MIEVYFPSQNKQTHQKMAQLKSYNEAIDQFQYHGIDIHETKYGDDKSDYYF